MNEQSPKRARSEETDTVLVARVRQGSETALSQLYRRYVQPIYRFIFAQVRDHDTAEDLTSETFARMLHGLEGFRGDARFKNWLYQIARNAVRNHRRSHAYRRTLPLNESLVQDEPNLEPGPEEQARSQEVLALLAPLPPRYRQVLELRFLAGHSVEETADRMGISIANAKVLQHRALKKAAAVIAAQVEEHELQAAR